MTANGSARRELDDEYKIEPVVIASELRLTVERVSELRFSKTAYGTNGRRMRAQLTDAQVKSNLRAVGRRQAFIVNQVINMIDHRLVDRANTKLMERLAQLTKLLEEFLGGRR